MKAVLFSAFYLFALLGIVFIPSASYVLPFQDDLAIWVFGDLVNLFVDDHLDFTSDTKGLNILLVILFILSFLLAFVLARTKFWKEKNEKVIAFIQLLIVYYIASRMMVYGFDKVFKTQFYLPEPNTLYTPLGLLSKDILFWSVMGTSKWYCLLSGFAEIIPAGMLLFKRTRVAGLLMMSFVLLHVLTINIGFDISVKMYSLFLLFLAVLLLSPHFRPLVNFLLKYENARLQKGLSLFEGKTHIKRGLKFFVVGMVFIEALKFPISTGYLSDDNLPRPSLHGAYEILWSENTERYINEETPLFKRFFVHRNDFFIFQYQNDSLVDFKMENDSANHMIRLNDPEQNLNNMVYKLYQNGTFMDLGIPIEKEDTLWYVSKKLNWKGLPALQDEFHWTIDEFSLEE